MNPARQAKKLRTFALPAGFPLTPKNIVEELVGRGTEGEVYKIRERSTGLFRAAKLFFPNGGGLHRKISRYARKLERLSDCELIVRYHHIEEVNLVGSKVQCLITEYVSGTLLTDILAASPGKRLAPFEALDVDLQLSHRADRDPCGTRISWRYTRKKYFC